MIEFFFRHFFPLMGCFFPMLFVGYIYTVIELRKTKRELLAIKTTHSKLQLLDHYASTTAE